MRHVVTHDLGLALARKAADAAFDSYRARFASHAPSLTWSSATRARASFSAAGVTLAGFVEVEPTAIVFDLEVPLLLRAFQRQALARLDQECAAWIERARRGELD